MKLSARNVLGGKISEITLGQAQAKVKIDIGDGVFLTSSITVDAVEELGLKVGDDVSAIIKSTDVMIGK